MMSWPDGGSDWVNMMTRGLARMKILSLSFDIKMTQMAVSVDRQLIDMPLSRGSDLAITTDCRISKSNVARHCLLGRN